MVSLRILRRLMAMPIRANRWNHLAQYVAAWLPAAGMGIYLKYSIMSQRGFLVVARNTGRLDDLSLPDRLSFFQNDVLVTLVIVPLAIVLACYFITPRWRAPVVAATSVAFALLFYGNMQSRGSIGRSLSLDLLTDAARFGGAY